MSRQQDVTNLFNFLIEFLRETPVEETQSKKLLVEHHTPTLEDIIPSPKKVVDMMHRVDDITKSNSVSRTVNGLREKVGEVNAKLREAEIERLESEKFDETFVEALGVTTFAENDCLPLK